MTVWQGDPPRPCLKAFGDRPGGAHDRLARRPAAAVPQEDRPGIYEWTPAPGLTYAIHHADPDDDPKGWYVMFPDGNYDGDCTSLGEARDRVGRHYSDRWGAP
jgi:hypothetical protein